MRSSLKLGPLRWCKLVVAGLCFLLGVFGICFFTYMENYIAIWKCVTLVLACTVFLHLNISVIRGKLLEKYNPKRLKRLRRVSAVLGVTSFLLFISHLKLGHMNNQGFQWERNGHYVVCIPSFLSMVWFIELAFEANSHLKEIPQTKMYALMSEEGTVVV